jgi:hypothetical protein
MSEKDKDSLPNDNGGYTAPLASRAGHLACVPKRPGVFAGKAIFVTEYPISSLQWHVILVDPPILGRIGYYHLEISLDRSPKAGVSDVATNKTQKIEIENVNLPGNVKRLDVDMYEAMKRASTA